MGFKYEDIFRQIAKRKMYRELYETIKIFKAVSPTALKIIKDEMYVKHVSY